MAKPGKDAPMEVFNLLMEEYKERKDIFRKQMLVYIAKGLIEPFGSSKYLQLRFTSPLTDISIEDIRTATSGWPITIDKVITSPGNGELMLHRVVFLLIKRD